MFQLPGGKIYFSLIQFIAHAVTEADPRLPWGLRMRHPLSTEVFHVKITSYHDHQTRVLCQDRHVRVKSCHECQFRAFS